MQTKFSTIITRGEIYYADLTPARGSEQGGLRPVLILQNNIGNKYAPTTIVAPLTSRLTKKKLPTHCELSIQGLSKDSVVLLEQVRVIDKSRLRQRMGELSPSQMLEVEAALKCSLGLL